MHAVWAKDGAAAADVREALATAYAPTTVSTVLRILEEKGFVRAKKDGRRHIYLPLVAKAAYEKRSVKHLLASVFSGDRQQLVRTLFSGVNAKELERLERLLGDSK